MCSSDLTRVNRAGLISKKSALEADGAIGVQIKSLLLVLEKSHNLVFSGLLILATLKQVQGRAPAHREDYQMVGEVGEDAEML